MKSSDCQLGDRVKCSITGYSGIVVVLANWLNGCTRVGVQPEKLKDGVLQETQNFDVEQLTMVNKAVHKPTIVMEVEAPEPKKEATKGGPPNFGRF